jgi:uncharacterized membrane protein
MDFLKGFLGRFLGVIAILAGLFLIFSGILACAFEVNGSTTTGWILGVVGLAVVVFGKTLQSWAQHHM